MRGARDLQVCAARQAGAHAPRAAHGIERKPFATAKTPPTLVHCGPAARPTIRAGFFRLTRLNTLLPHRAGAKGAGFAFALAARAVRVSTDEL
jgi:hypothetical protein